MTCSVVREPGDPRQGPHPRSFRPSGPSRPSVMPQWRSPLLITLTLAAWACTGSESGVPAEPALGPRDGRDLSGVALDRIQVGDTAPDFTLESLAGGPVTLSDHRGRRDVVLVFYRGHW